LTGAAIRYSSLEVLPPARQLILVVRRCQNAGEPHPYFITWNSSMRSFTRLLSWTFIAGTVPVALFGCQQREATMVAQPGADAKSPASVKDAPEKPRAVSELAAKADAIQLPNAQSLDQAWKRYGAVEEDSGKGRGVNVYHQTMHRSRSGWAPPPAASREGRPP
jgi:hypothetical protein